jgi:hypothetical protein
MSAAKPGKPTTRRGRIEVARCEPTPELLRHRKHVGATCLIDRAVERGVLTQEQGQGVEAFAGVRRVLGVAEYQPAGVLAQQQPQAPSGETSDERIYRAKVAYADACALLDAIPGAFDEVVSLCDQRPPRNVDALKAGAAALAGLFVAGNRAA